MSKSIAKMHPSEYNFLANEWRSGSILSPFFLINYCDTLSTPRTWRNKKNDRSDEICVEVANLFLDCTAYRTSEDATLREGEKALMAAMLNYLYREAPQNEMHMAMICSLAMADIQSDYSRKSDLERLFDMLREKHIEHPAVLHFDEYLGCAAGRAKMISSMCRRLSPLISFQTENDDGIFEHCSRNEIFEMAVGLLQNCGGCLASASQTKKDELAFVAAALYLMFEAYPINKQNAKALFQLLNNPTLLDSHIKNVSPNGESVRYWKVCRENVLKGKYDKYMVESIESFFMEFK